MKITVGLLAPKEKGMEEDMPMGMGLLDEMMVDEDKYPLDKKSNNSMTKALMESRHLGALDPTNPKDFWVTISEFWDMPEEEAKLRRCGNCEYFDNTIQAKKAMDVVPVTEFDTRGGQRGYCHKYTFICHDLRVCDQWEEKEYDDEE
jgi:hypothetical protein